MKVYAVYEQQGEVTLLFATRELAEAHLEPAVRALWERVLDPSIDLGHGWGGTKWRVEHYRQLGWEKFRAQMMQNIEEHDVIGGASGVRDTAAADTIGEALG